MNTQFSYKGNKGGYEFSRQGNIIICTFNGIVSEGVVQRYLADLTTLAKQMYPTPWAYVANAADGIAAVPKAEAFLKEAYQVSIEHNCVSDAYFQITAMCLAQLGRLRQACNLTDDVNQRAFDSLDQAIDFVSQQLDMAIVSKHLTAV